MTLTLRRQFSEVDQVLALLPFVGAPFQAKFVGPYTVVRQLSEQNDLIAIPDYRKKNLLWSHTFVETILCSCILSG